MQDMKPNRRFNKWLNRGFRPARPVRASRGATQGSYSSRTLAYTEKKSLRRSLVTILQHVWFWYECDMLAESPPFALMVCEAGFKCTMVKHRAWQCEIMMKLALNRALEREFTLHPTADYTAYGYREWATTLHFLRGSYMRLRLTRGSRTQILTLCRDWSNARELGNPGVCSPGPHFMHYAWHYFAWLFCYSAILRLFSRANNILVIVYVSLPWQALGDECHFF